MPFDVTGIGSISIDFIGTADSWPSPGSKVALSSFAIQGGGVVATALAAVARLGGSARFAGCLGYSEHSLQALESLERDGVDTSLVKRTPGAEPIRAFVFSATSTGERTIFFTRNGVEYPHPEELPDPDWFDKTKTLLVSAGAGLNGLEMARLAQANNVPVILDAEHVGPLSEEFIRVSDYIVVPWTFAKAYTGAENLEKVLRTLRRLPCQTVVVTQGAEGCTVLTGETLERIPAFCVETVDTTGCGDVFHGAFALAIARGDQIAPACSFASAAAALAATRLGGRDGIPTLMDVRRLLRVCDLG